MRHAKSSWKNNSLSDHDRPLNSRGSKDAPKIFQKLINENWIPDLILLSSSKRTQETLSNMNFNAKETKNY
jgi:phosphohistidine phosphatase